MILEVLLKILILYLKKIRPHGYFRSFSFEISSFETTSDKKWIGVRNLTREDFNVSRFGPQFKGILHTVMT